MLNKKHNLKSGNCKDKRKGFETKKERNQKKRKDFRKKIAIEYFDVVLFMNQKQRRKERKERDQETKREQKRKTRRKKETKEQERDWEREIEQGAGQKGWGRKKEKHRKLTKNAFFRGKTGFFLLKAKKGKQKKKQNKNKKTINKEGLGPSEVALLATSPDP